MNAINIHPLLVHFPIAFFVLYAILEFVSFIDKFKKQTYWFYLKATLVILGCFAALVAGIAGKLVESRFADRRELVHLHSTINELASAVFVLIAFAYFISWLRKVNINFPKIGILWKLSLFWEKIVLQTPLVYLLAVTGLILITIGGALGGAIAFGPNFDPFTNFIYSLFFH
jgi:uncharacterized membrane protein